MIWLLITVPLAMLASWYHPRLWVRLDVKRFVANGAKDSLQQTFHRQRFTWRIAIALAIAFGGAAPLLWVSGLAFVLLATALLVWQACYFTYDFNPRLNVARKLPYISKYHVSWSPNAAEFPDRYIWQRTVKAWPQDGTWPLDQLQQMRVEHAAVLMEDLLDKVLRYGAVASLLLTIVAAWVAYA